MPLKGGMRIVMMATGDIALPSLVALKEEGVLVALVTQPDKPAGRHHRLTAPRIKLKAQEFGIPVLQPENVRTAEALSDLQALEPDLLVVMAYGQILSQEVIDLPKIACINAHASLLPRHRGASCIQAAIEAGDDETGITILHVVKKLDAGDIICRAAIPLRGTETAEDLHDTLAQLAPRPLLEAIHAIQEGTDESTPQDESLMTYAPKLQRSNSCIDWSALQVARKIRAYHSWPGTFTFYPSVKSGNDKTIKLFPPVDVFTNISKPLDACPGMVLEANASGLIISCGGVHGGAIRISSLQPPGARKMNVESFFAGHTILPGMILGLASSAGS